MEEINNLVAQNLKSLRDEKNLSLDGLAELTGVSKSMLGQIERGDSSPTIATLWKIANGLKVTFSALLDAPQSDTTLLRRGEVTPFLEDNGKYRLFPLFPITENRPFEIYTIELDPGGYLSAEPHPAGTQEFITLYDGELTIRAGQDEYTLHAGDSIRFKADRPHAYHNSGQALARLHLVMHYT
jgi:XRE family transcriptional regulator, regulator of sulfur utilization